MNHLNKQHSAELRAYAKASASNKDYFHKTYKEANKEIDDKTIEEDRLSILNDEITFQLNRDALLAIMLDMGSIVASHLLNMKWAIIETDDTHPFIASDNFMHIYHPTIREGYYKLGLALRDVCVHIPISKNISLMLVNNNNFTVGSIFNAQNPPIVQGETVDLYSLIDSFNKAIFIKCQDYVFAHSDSPALKKCFTEILKAAKEHQAGNKG